MRKIASSTHTPPPPFILNHPRQHVWNSLKVRRFLSLCLCRMLRALKRCCHLVEQESALFIAGKKKYLSLLVLWAKLDRKVLRVGGGGTFSYTSWWGWGHAGRSRNQRVHLIISSFISFFYFLILYIHCNFSPSALRAWTAPLPVTLWVEPIIS